jgi:molybdenum-dependent DNA-binding transcriptional regulator ModE
LTPRLNKSLNANKFVASESTIVRIGDAAMDRFQVIESFVRVAHAGSFTKAARQLGLSRALISRRIIELEDRLGVRLLNRSTRSVSLTAEGRAQPLQAGARRDGSGRA